MRKAYVVIISLFAMCCVEGLFLGIPARSQSEDTQNESSTESQEATPEEKASFDAACKENTIEAFDKYLKQYPDGKFVSEVKLKRESLRWQGTKGLDYLSGFDSYLREYPDGKFASEAKQRIKELEEKKCGGNIDDFIPSYEEQYNQWVVPAYTKYKTGSGFDRIMASMDLMASLMDIQEVEAVWDHCYVENATSAQKEKYSEIFEKVNEAKLELAKLAE